MSRGTAIQQAYCLQMVRAVAGHIPAGQYVASDPAALAGLSLSLTDYEQARAVLRLKGWGDFGTSLLEVANAIPERTRNA